MPADAHPAASPTPEADRAVEGLAARYAAVVGRHLPRAAPFALLDFPDHANVGDSAIYAGEIAFLDAHVGRPASYVCSVRTYRQDVDRFAPEGTVLLHGGGNFGDVWPRHHALRLDAIARYRHRKVVQLPQSIQFGDASGIEATARAIGAHPDFTLLVRDEPSRELAERHFDCAVELCPDAAYCLRRLPTSTPGTVPVLSLLRADHEQASGVAAAATLRGLGPVIDWPEGTRWRHPALPRAVDKVLGKRLPESTLMMRMRERTYRRHADALVATGARVLEPGRLVVTDRLHGHILSSLMRRPHVVLDNSYGKIARFMAAWGDDALADRAAEGADLAAQIDALARGAPGPRPRTAPAAPVEV